MANVLRHYTLTAGTSSAVLLLEPNVYSAYIRAPTTNTGVVYVMIDESPANATASSPLAAGDSLTIDLSQAIQVLAQNGELSQEKFLRSISYAASAINQTINVEVLTWV